MSCCAKSIVLYRSTLTRSRSSPNIDIIIWTVWKVRLWVTQMKYSPANTTLTRMMTYMSLEVVPPSMVNSFLTARLAHYWRRSLNSSSLRRFLARLSRDQSIWSFQRRKNESTISRSRSGRHVGFRRRKRRFMTLKICHL